MHDASFRNLFLGFFCIFVALMLFCGAWVLLGELSLIPFVTAILVLFLLTSLWAFGVHRQRGGLFLSLGLVSIVGALVPLLLGVVLNLPAGQAYLAQMRTVPGNNNQAQGGYPGGSIVQAQPAGQQTPLLSEAFGIYPPTGSQTEQVRVLSDSRVELDGRVYLMRAGQIFPVHSRSDEGVVIRAKDYLVTLSRDMVDVVSPSVSVASTTSTAAPTEPPPAATPQVDKSALLAKSQAEAMRRYPALAIQDSDENRIYVDAYSDIKLNRPDYLEDPNWPLKLADELGTAHGWQDITKPSTRKPSLTQIDPSQIPTGEDESTLFQSDTLYLDPAAAAAATQPGAAALPDDAIPGAPNVEELIDDKMIDSQGGEAEVKGEVDLDSAPPLEISPDR